MARGGASPGLVLGLLGAGALLILAAGSPPGRQLGGIVQGQLGRFFSWAELTRSRAASRLGLDNTPPPEAQAAMRRLVEVVLDPLRTALGRPVRVTSGFRTAAVNEAVNGSTTSQHMRGEAVDIVVDGVSAEALAAFIVRLGVPFDQVIWYDAGRGGHVHVSYTERRRNRGQMLHAPEGGGFRVWSPAGSRLA